MLFFTIAVLPKAPAIENKISFSFKIDLFNSLLWVSPEIYEDMLDIKLSWIFSTLTKLIPLSSYFFGVVPFVTKEEIFLILVKFHSSLNSLNQYYIF